MKTRAFLLFLLIPMAALATDRFYDDVIGVSPNGRYRVEARSPDNQQAGGHRAFQASFLYKCFEAPSNRIVWVREQPMGKPESMGSATNTYRFPNEGSPVEIYVDDFGTTLVWTGWSELLLIPPDGRLKAKLDILGDGLSRSDRKRYVQDTTAGPCWSGNSYWYFASDGGRTYFCIRTWWDRRIIVDLSDSRFVQGDRKLLRSLESEEKAFVLRTLRAATADVAAVSKEHPEHDCEHVHGMLTAVHMSGRMQIREAIPFLRQLESIDYIGSSTGSSPWEYGPPEGKVRPNGWETFSIRRDVQLALRRLGEKADPLPATRFEINVPFVQVAGEDPMSESSLKRWDESRKRYLRKPGQPAPETMAFLVKTGMTPEQVIDLIDAPDYVNTSDEAWEYDMDDSAPYTIVIYWGKAGVAKIKKNKPYWKDGDRRYQDD
ncbi:MAG: hypothetical protein WCO42_09375 [bacterium]